MKNAYLRYSHMRKPKVLSSGCDGPGSRDQGAGARQTEQHSSTATGRGDGVDRELESRHARDEGVKDQDGAWRVTGQVQTGATGVSSVNGFVQK